MWHWRCVPIAASAASENGASCGEGCSNTFLGDQHKRGLVVKKSGQNTCQKKKMCFCSSVELHELLIGEVFFYHNCSSYFFFAVETNQQLGNYQRQPNVSCGLTHEEFWSTYLSQEKTLSIWLTKLSHNLNRSHQITWYPKVYMYIFISQTPPPPKKKTSLN